MKRFNIITRKKLSYYICKGINLFMKNRINTVNIYIFLQIEYNIRYNIAL